MNEGEMLNMYVSKKNSGNVRVTIFPKTEITKLKSATLARQEKHEKSHQSAVVCEMRSTCSSTKRMEQLELE